MAGKAEVIILTKMRKVFLAPSILSADPLNISGSIDGLENNFDWLHVDIMDGHFVKNLSFGAEVVYALRKKYPDLFLDVHLMIDKLETILPIFMKPNGASLITIHAETDSHFLHASLSEIKKAGFQVGISLCPPTPVSAIENVIDLVDLVLIMSVTPGFGGQKFIENSLKKAHELVSLREVNKLNYKIEIDGGINADNFVRVAKAGVDVLVMGSAVFGNENPAMLLKKMKSQLKEEVETF